MSRIDELLKAFGSPEDDVKEPWEDEFEAKFNAFTPVQRKMLEETMVTLGTIGMETGTSALDAIPVLDALKGMIQASHKDQS